jgi:uncharacterized membrane protein
MTKSDSLVKKIAENAIIAAIYFVLTIALGSLAYDQIQFRISELLVLLCFWRPDFVMGVTLGCLLSNIASPLGWYDIVFGTLATLVSSLLVAYASPRLIVATFYPIVANAFIVAWELLIVFETPFWASVMWVGIGEATVIFASYFLWMGLSHNKGFMNALAPRRHVDVHW